MLTINKFRTNIKSILPKAGLLLLMFVFLFVSVSLNDLNNSINDYLFNKLGINMFIYGDINDDDGHTETLEELNAVKEILYDAKEYLESKNLANVYVEEYLYTQYIYSAKDVDDSENYSFLFYDRVNGSDYLQDISKYIEANRHYETIIENHYVDTSKDDEFYIYYYGYIPKLVGVDKGIFSDLKLKSASIVSGRTFNDDEINNGKYVCVVPNYSYYINKDEMRQAEVGDIVSITIDINGVKTSFEFEVVGVAFGNKGSINIQNTEYSEQENEFYLEPDNYLNIVYIPQKCLDEIYKQLVQIENDNNLQLKKVGEAYVLDETLKTTYEANFDERSKSDFTGDGNTYYGQNNGIRPVLVSIDNIDSIKEVSAYLDTCIEKLNNVSNRTIEYTYYSNFDNYVSAISSLSTNTKLFSFLSIFSIALFLVVLTLYIINDIEANKKEIAIRACLGQRKASIFKDIFLEYVLTSIIPFAISVAVAYFAGKAYISYINSSFFEVTSGTLIFNNYIKKISVDPLTTNTIIKITIMWFSSLTISLLLTFIKISTMSAKKVLMEGEL